MTQSHRNTEELTKKVPFSVGLHPVSCWKYTLRKLPVCLWRKATLSPNLTSAPREASCASTASGPGGAAIPGVVRITLTLMLKGGKENKSLAFESCVVGLKLLQSLERNGKGVIRPMLDWW